MTVALVDDQVLAAVLRGETTLDAAEVFTTGCWYLRLCTAVARNDGGALSRPFAALPQPLRDDAIAAVLALPDEIGLLSLRELAPLMGRLARVHRPLNLLSREALAAALTLDATVVMAVGNENSLLAAALATAHRPVTRLVV